MSDPEISPEALAQLQSQASKTSSDQTQGTLPTPTLLDVREPWEVATASIPGAVLIPMSEFTSRAHAELDPDQPYVVFCHHGARSLSVTMWMRNQGFDHARSLSGGIDHWSRTIDPTIPRY